MSGAVSDEQTISNLVRCVSKGRRSGSEDRAADQTRSVKVKV